MISRQRVFVASVILLGELSFGGATPLAFAQRFGSVRGATDNRDPADDPGTDDERDDLETTLDIEILMPPGGGTPLDGQKWMRVFESLDQSVRMRSPVGREKPEVTERIRGPFRDVKMVGLLDHRGVLMFPQHEFEPTDAKALEDWLTELKRYGAQGSPAGKPLWGLNQQQFDDLFRDLGAQKAPAVLGRPFQEALDSLPFEKSLRIVFSPAAERVRLDVQPSSVEDELEGLSLGTSLAFLLLQQNLGFHPERGPSGEIHLLVEPLNEIPQPWPVGWPLKDSTQRSKLFPSVFEWTTTGFNQAGFFEVVDAVEAKVKVPILVDRRATEDHKLNELKLSFAPRRTSWSLILRSVRNKARLAQNYRLDEAGTPFMTLEPYAPIAPEDAQRR